MKTVFSALSRELEAGRVCELVTILSVRGTAPREPGCTMLVSSSGEQLAGTVGGGCIEWQALKMAARLLKNGESREEIFEHGCRTEPEGESCGAVITLRFTFCSPEDTPLRTALALAADSRSGTLFLKAAKKTEFLPGIKPKALFADGTLALYLPPPDRVLLFGAGHVATALVPLLKPLGFSVTVCDNRPDLAVRARFPEAEAVLCSPFTEDLTAVTDARPEDYIVIMSASHGTDGMVLSHFLDKDYRYIGVLGSRKKAAAIREKCLKKGVPEGRLDAVHIPIGLSIGARTPEEVALSVAAELVKVRAELLLSGNGDSHA